MNNLPTYDSGPADPAMPGRVLTATFATRSAADHVRDVLERMGISPDNIRIVEDAPNPASVETPEETGWTALADSQPHDENARRVEKGILEGSCVLGVEIDVARENEVAQTLRDLGGVLVKSSIRR